MLKLKTKRSFLKRLKITKNKKILRFRGGKRHLLIGKNSKRKRQLGKKTTVSKAERKIINTALPYSL